MKKNFFKKFTPSFAALGKKFFVEENVTVGQFDDFWTIVDKSSVSSVVDIGCHQGRHIVEVLRPQLPDAEIVGIEPKDENFKQCMKIKMDKTKFLKLDCRKLTKETVGVFDFVWCFGLIYHLDDPTLLMKSIKSITHDSSYVLIEGHIAVREEQACLPDPNPRIIKKVLDGEVYYGKIYREFKKHASQSEKDTGLQSSLDNVWSFWLTYDSIITLFRKYGFNKVIELRSSSPDCPLGPGLFYVPVDAKREWSRRLFLLSPKREFLSLRPNGE